MTGRDRIRTALAHREPDRVPIDIGGANACGIMLPVYRQVVERLGLAVEPTVREFAEQLAWIDEPFCDAAGIDTRRLTLSGKALGDQVQEDDRYFRYVDEWGRTLMMPKDGGHYFDTTGFPLRGRDEAAYEWPEPIRPSRLEALETVAASYIETGAAVCSPTTGNGFLQLGAQLFGYDDWFAMLALEPARVERFLDRLLQHKIAYWDAVLQRFGDRIDVACESDDLGTQKGPWISLDMWRNLMKPRLAALIAFIKQKASIPVYLHSCGSVYDYIPDLIEAGVDILNPIQVSAAKMDTRQLKKEFGNDIVFWGGGVDTQHVLPNGSVQQVRDEVKRRIDDLAPGGGFVFAAVHNIQSDVPPENVIAMIETVHEYGRY